MNKTLLWLTKRYIRGIGGQAKEVVQIQLGKNVEKEVVTFSKKDSLFLGQVTLFNTIIIEESLFSKYSPEVQEFVLTHEYAHTKQKIRYIFLPIMLALTFSLFFLSLFISIQAILFLIALQFALLVNLVMDGLVYFILMVLIFSSLSWWMEGTANYYAITQLGKNKVASVVQEMKEKNPKPKLSHKIIGYLTHPPIRLSLKAYDFIHRSG